MMGRTLTLSLAICFLSAAAISQPAPYPDPKEYIFAVKNAYIDSNQHVHIVQTDGTQIEPAPEPDQVGSSSASIASDNVTVGWLASSMCCRYHKSPADDLLSPFPKRLIIYRQGQIVHKFGVGEDEMISRWHFLSDGKEAALCAQDVLLNWVVDRCERVEIDSGPKDNVLETWDGRSGKPMPDWVKENKQ